MSDGGLAGFLVFSSKNIQKAEGASSCRALLVERISMSVARRYVLRTQSEPFEGFLVPLQETGAQEGLASAHDREALQSQSCPSARPLQRVHSKQPIFPRFPDPIVGQDI